mmetsp:Transcript_1798/g.4162  ORF Transcript_1798/g.4162 Transcript_1798/m.4162 type:complete len:449 (-) Transcript_1798:1212-2558(-)
MPDPEGLRAEAAPLPVAVDGVEGDGVEAKRAEAGSSEARQGAAEEAGASERPKEHLVVLVHGLFGSDKHLKNVVKAMKSNFDEAAAVEVYVSNTNKRIKTLDGIEKCGERLIAELNDFLSKDSQKSLKTISFVGHSLGGLIVRYTIGHAFDPQKQTIFGLEPLHYVAICTPHVGCNDTYMSDQTKEDSLTPCLRWMSQIPCLGKVPALAFHVFEWFFVWLVLRKTGDELFLRDRSQIIVDMGSYEPALSKSPTCCAKAKPVDASGCHTKVPYLPALASFKERTCYGNIRGDHVVAWENATIRRKMDLPKISRKSAPYGIVNEEEPPNYPPAPAPSGDGVRGERMQARAVGEGEGKEAEAEAEEPCTLTKMPSMATCPKIEMMIRNLESLGWRRVDVKTKIMITKGAPWAHDNIISKTEGHENFKIVSLHSSNLIVNSIKRYNTDNAAN